MTVAERHPPVFVISLRRATDRRARIGENLAAIGLVFEYLDATDGAALTSDERRSYSEWRSLRENKRGMRTGEVGAALSHLRVYREMARRGMEQALIIEDDVDVGPDLVTLLEAREELPRGWDVVTFHSLFAGADPEPLPDVELPLDYRCCRYRRMVHGAQCYLITRRGAERLLEVAYPIGITADDLIFRSDPAGLTVFGIEPSPVGHGAFASEITEHRWDPLIPRHHPLHFAPARALVVASGRVRRYTRARLMHGRAG